MQDVLKDLDSAFRLISTIAVSGDAVDVMAEARNHLRKAYAEIKNLKEATDNVDCES